VRKQFSLQKILGKTLCAISPILSNFESPKAEREPRTNLLKAKYDGEGRMAQNEAIDENNHPPEKGKKEAEESAD
jgi:hypothetical protein